MPLVTSRLTAAKEAPVPQRGTTPDATGVALAGLDGAAHEQRGRNGHTLRGTGRTVPYVRSSVVVTIRATSGEIS
jgi:hypothetical protein